MLRYFLMSLEQEGPYMPIIIDEDSTIECIGKISQNHVISLEECKTGNIENIFLYEKEEEKKHLGILEARRCISDINIQPYGGKAIYILRDFDEATPEAMNALLKTLEEPPSYAVILLVVKNPENIIETVRSRTRTLFRNKRSNLLPEEIKKMIHSHFREGDLDFIRYLHEGKYEGGFAQEILLESAQYANTSLLNEIERALIHLFQVNESPRNILDRVFLCQY